MAAQYKYIVDIIGNSKQFVQEMQNAVTSAGRLEAVTEDVDAGGTKFQGTLGALGSGLGKVALAIGGPLAALGFVKDAMESTEGSADKLEEITGTLEGTMSGLMQTIASGEWDRLIQNMVNTAKATRGLKVAMDELEDVKASNTIRKGLLEVERDTSKMAAIESTNAEDKKKYTEEAIIAQKALSSITIDEMSKDLSATEEFFGKRMGWTEEESKYNFKKVREMAGNYEYFFGKDSIVEESIKKRVEDLKYLQNVSVTGLTKAQSNELSQSQSTLRTIEMYKVLQNDVSKPGQFNEYVKGIGALNSANAQATEDLFRLQKQIESTEKAMDKIGGTSPGSSRAKRDPVTDNPLLPVKVGNIPTLTNGEALKKIDKLLPDVGPKVQNYADEEDLKREMDSLEKINNAKLLSELEYLDEKKKLDLAAAQGNATEILAIETKYANDINAVKIKKAQEWLNFAGGALDALSQFNEAAKQKELDAAGNNAEAKERIEKKYRAKEQAMAISQAIINGALAVTNILATVPGGIANPLSWVAIGLTAATTAAQIAVIGSQKFADGGIVSGPTRALVGEYQGAKNNPEVIAPLNKLNDMIRPAIVAAIAQTGTLKAQKFAGGGLISGPTIGLMGEYPGVRSNPEVVAPLSKLQQMIQPASSGGEVVFRIGERELVGVLVKGDRVKRNIRGR